MSFTVDTEKLASSAITVTAHGETLATNHTSTDTRFATAESGWLGRSATALNNRLTQWATASATLLTNIGADATAMQNGAIAYVAHEEESARAMAQVYTQAPAAPSSPER
ncbi:MAG: WXG100 family type VII secretion target [Mycobacterium sp.]